MIVQQLLYYQTNVVCLCTLDGQGHGREWDTSLTVGHIQVKPHTMQATHTTSGVTELQC